MVRQAQTFLSLMQNYGDVQKYVTAETESAGLAQDRYAIYLKSVEAAQNRVTASWEKLWMSTVESGLITWFLDLASSMLDVIAAGGGLTPIITTIIGAIILLKRTELGIFFLDVWKGIVTQAIPALRSLWAALTTTQSVAIATGIAMDTALGIVGLVIAGISLGIMAWQNYAQKSVKELEDLNRKIQESNDKLATLRTNLSSINELTTKYKDLKKVFDETGVVTQEFLDVQNKLHELVPSLSITYDEYGNALIDAGQNMSDLTQATKDQIAAQLILNQALANDKAKGLVDTLLFAQSSKEEADKGFRGGGRGRQELSSVEIAQRNLDYAKAISDAKIAVSQMSPEIAKAFRESLSGTNLAVLFAEEINPAFQGFQEQSELTQAGETAAEFVYKGFADTLETLSSSSNLVDSLVSKSSKQGGKLGISDVAAVSKEYGAEAIRIENGELKLNIDLIKERQIEQANAAVTSAELALASKEEIAALQAYADQLISQSQTTFGEFEQTAWQYDQLLWQIANDAETAGYQFEDMEGKALTSAQNIYDYLSSSPAAFDNFVAQVASQTGQTVAEVTNQILAMINYTKSQLNSLNGGVRVGMGESEYGEKDKGGFSTPVSFTMPNLFSRPAPSYSSGSGGSSKTKAEERAEARAKKLKEIEDQISDARKEATDSLKDQLKVYKDIIDVRKKLLDSMESERDYQQDIEEKNKSVEKIQNELLALQFDTSEEARARRLELQDELVKAQQELGNAQFSHSIDAQKDALDAEYNAFESRVNAAIAAVEHMSATSTSSFATQLAAILATIGTPPQYHSGAEKGVVMGGGGLRSNEVFAKLMAGEVVSNSSQIDRFMKVTLPQLMQGSSTANGGNMEINMPINVAGSLDKSVLPDIKKMVDATVKQLNENMMNRGVTRRADAFQI